jgi:S-adenosylmethionine decarboxylase
MFFEGAEKRIIIEFNKNIRKKYDSLWWYSHIKDIGCNILSMITNEYYDIYLLSESILLVSNNTILIKTCGTTSPLNILSIINKNIKSINYSHPTFLKLKEQPLIYTNPNYIINYINEYTEQYLEYNKLLFLNMISNKIDINYNEIIIWDFIWSDNFISMIKKYLLGWKIDDYIFEPQGYSLNGCYKDKYITIHSTPNEECSYMSIETNYDLRCINMIIELLKPKKIGIITKNKEIFNSIKIEKRYKYIYTNGIYIKFYS